MENLKRLLDNVIEAEATFTAFEPQMDRGYRENGTWFYLKTDPLYVEHVKARNQALRALNAYYWTRDSRESLQATGLEYQSAFRYRGYIFYWGYMNGKTELCVTTDRELKF